MNEIKQLKMLSESIARIEESKLEKGTWVRVRNVKKLTGDIATYFHQNKMISDINKFIVVKVGRNKAQIVDPEDFHWFDDGDVSGGGPEEWFVDLNNLRVIPTEKIKGERIGPSGSRGMIGGRQRS